MKSNHKICAGIVTYNPNLELLKDNIEAVSKQIDYIIIWDNGSDNYTEIMDELSHFSLSSYCNVELMTQHYNEGIASALNHIFEIANSKKYDWLLTLDQDSIIPKDMIKKYSSYLCVDDVGIICPIIKDRNKEDVIVENESISYIDYCITSASLTNIAAWRKIGGFDEYIFIDNVDDDFCRNLRLHQFKILQLNSVVLSHSIGEIKQVKIFKKIVNIYNHSSFRKYYQIRNWFYLDYKYDKRIRLKTLIHTFITYIKVFIWEKDKRSKFNLMTKGVVDGLKSNKHLLKEKN